MSGYDGINRLETNSDIAKELGHDFRHETIRVRVNGFCDPDMTLMFTESSMCNKAMCVDKDGRLLFNNPFIISSSMDEIGLAVECQFYIAESEIGCSKTRSLFEVIDNPSVFYDRGTKTFKKSSQYFYSREHDVCISLRESKAQNGYRSIDQLYVCYNSDKLDNLQSFLNKYLITNKEVDAL